MSSPEFVVGGTYHDTRGSYQVTSLDGIIVSYKYTDGEYADGTERRGDAEIKWRIECNFRHRSSPSYGSLRSSSSKRTLKGR